MQYVNKMHITLLLFFLISVSVQQSPYFNSSISENSYDFAHNISISLSQITLKVLVTTIDALGHF